MSLAIEIQVCQDDIIELCKTERFISQPTNVKNALIFFKKSVVDGVVKVEYSQKNEGRFWGKPDINALPRWIKQTLLHQKYSDIDISNCHPNILLKLCNKHNVRCEALKYYCENRDLCLTEIMDLYKISKPDAKDLFNIMNFGGGFNTWTEDKKIVNAVESEFIKTYYEEAKRIKEQFVIIPDYKRFFDMAKKEKDNPYEIVNSGMAFIMQHYESVYLVKALEIVKNKNMYIPAHDGFYLHKDRYKAMGLEKFIKMINEYVDEPGITFIHKEMNEAIDLKTADKVNINFWDSFDLYNIATEIIKKKTLTASNGVLYMYNGVFWEADTPEKNYSLFSKFWSENYYYVIYDLMKQAFGINEEQSQSNKKINKKKKGKPTESEKAENENTKSIGLHQKSWERQLANSRVFHFRPLVTLVLQRLENSSLRFNEIPYLFAFNNRIFDLRINDFIEPKPEQYISETCGYNYENDENLENKKTYLMSIFKTILPEEYDLELFLKYCSTGLSMTLIEKICLAHGSGRNGKGLFQEFNKYTLGNYFYALTPTSIQSKLKDGSNQALANIQGKRLIVTSEPDQDQKINTSILKLLTGCSVINARALYSKQTDTLNFGTYILECNSKPKLDIVEQAITQRLFVIHFPIKFIEKEVYENLEEKQGYGIVNPKYKDFDFLKSYKIAYFHILADAYQNYIKNSSFLLQQGSRSHLITETYFQDSDDFTSWFYTNYKKVETDDEILISLADLRKEFIEYKKQFEFKFEIKIGTFYEKMASCPMLCKFIKHRNTYYQGQQLKKPMIIGHIKLNVQEKEDVEMENEIGQEPLKCEESKPHFDFKK
jgi:phage/plasmid-associated DNA primase